ncbi:MAG TPA: chromate efflux transporter [Bacteroidia bacterium]|jgi:chromate transporter
MTGKPEPPSFKEAFLFWLKLGFISFGGPAGQIAIMHEFLVEKKKWLSESKFLHALNYCMLLPGPEAQQMATYTGWLLHGTRGGLAAGILFILPSIFILLGLSILYVLYGQLPLVYSILNGLKPAIIAIVVLALVKIGKRSLTTVLHYIIAISSFIAICFFNVQFPLIIIATILTGVIVQRYGASYLGKERPEAAWESGETGYFINSGTVIPHAGFNKGRLIKQSLTGLLLWLVPFCSIVFLADNDLWGLMAWFFTKAALVTFGGAYAVLPYVAQVSVEKFHWLTEFQMIDGLALGETTPGPLIMVLAFVGFMAGFNQPGFSILSGTAGLFISVWFTFLPSFLFVLIGAPWIERTHGNLRIKRILSVITAAVAGVILNLVIYLLMILLDNCGRSVSGECIFSIAWIIVSLVALQRFKINMILWIGISALAGLGYYLLFS